MKRLLTALLGSAAVAVTAGLSAAAPAMASTAAPAASTQHASTMRPAFNPGSGFYIDNGYLPNNGVIAFTAEGTGNQTETSSSGTLWNTVSATGGYKIENQNGKCEEDEGSAGNYHVNTETCMAGNGNQVWTFSGSGTSVNIQNTVTGGFMGDFSPNGPRPVYSESKGTGYYTGLALDYPS